jgi:hypothetical protein
MAVPALREHLLIKILPRNKPHLIDIEAFPVVAYVDNTCGASIDWKPSP